ncbi:MAG: prolyl oligopeptidase family serine peptidase [Actinomycetota bacterium]|nr:prolyl oligopeptidase family serine peptidase [Actinomycetota bacterium]
MAIRVDDILEARDLSEPCISPDGRWVALVVSDEDGSYLHLISLADGSMRRVSDELVRGGRGLGGGCFDWLPDSTGLVVVTKANGLQRMSLEGELRPLLAIDGRSISGPAVSPDGGSVAVVVDQAEIMVVDLTSGSAQRVDNGSYEFVLDPVWFQGAPVWQAWNSPNMPWDHSVVMSTNGVVSDNKCQHQQPRTDAAGNQLAWLDDSSGWLNVATQSGLRANEDFEHGTPTWGDGQRSWCFNSDGSHIAFVRNEDGFGRLCTLEMSTGKIREHAKAVHGQLSWVGNTLVALRTGGKTPTQVVAYDTTQIDDSSWPRRTLLIGARFDWTDHQALVEPQLLRVQSRDGIELHARLYSATSSPERRSNGRLLCMIHGGPTDQWQVTFMPRVTYWIDRGYDVLVPDHRGSTGHGRNFTQAMHGGWGDVDVDDVIDILESLGRPRAATALMGGSAGGLTALGVAMRRPDLVGCVRVVYPVCDIAALDATTHRFEAHYNRTLMGDVGETERKSKERSPIHHADKLAQVPLLIFHGTTDPVVDIAQSRQLAQAITAVGGNVELIEFDGEGHGFRALANNRREYEVTEAFLNRYLS